MGAALTAARVPAFRLPVRVYYQDTDAGGVVFHATYLDYFERARTEWLRDLGFDIGVLARRDGVIFIVREVRVAYARPAQLDELLDVTVGVEHIGRAQFTLAQQVLRGGEPLVRGAVNLACVSSGSLRPVRVPEALRTALVERGFAVGAEEEGA
jgi:acyl-CoA thioester hydrolase